MHCYQTIWSYFTKRIFFLAIILFTWTTYVAFGKDLQTSMSNIAKLTRDCIKNPTEPSTIFTEANPCDSRVNCRYGGICWKTSSSSSASGVTVFQRDGPGQGVCRCTLHCRPRSRRSRVELESGSVCGTDGRTYDDECTLRLAACRCQYPIRIKWRGTCEQEPKQSSGPKDATSLNYDLPGMDTFGSGDNQEACGDGTMCKYGAVCDLDAEDGPCLCKLDCHSTTSATVCGTDGRSYYNECYLKEEACHYQVHIAVDHAGFCTNNRGTSKIPLIDGDDGSGEDELMPDAEDSHICSSFNCKGEILEPVCGTGNRVFPNYCMLQYTACMEGKIIGLLHYGLCDVMQPVMADSHTDSAHADEDETEPPNPCDSAFCLGGAVCIPDGNDHKCSCDDICNKDLIMKPQKSITMLRDLPPLRELAAYMPEIHWYQFDDDEEIVDVEDDTILPSTVPPTKVASTTSRKRRKQKDHVIETINPIDDISPFSYIKKRKQQQHRNDDIDYKSNYKFIKQSWPRHFGRKRHNRGKRSADSSRIETFVNETLCGTDGKTYQDECQMKIHACHAMKVVKVYKVGPCPNYYKPELQKPDSKAVLHESTVSKTELQTSRTKDVTENPKSTMYFPTTEYYSSDHSTFKSKPDNEHTVTVDQVRDIPTTASPVADYSAEATVQSNINSSLVSTYEKTKNLTPGRLTNETSLESKQNHSSQDVLPSPDGSAHEYTWVIAIVATTTLIVVLLLVLSFFYFSSSNKSSSKQGESDATTFETIIVSSNDDKTFTTAEGTMNV